MDKNKIKIFLTFAVAVAAIFLIAGLIFLKISKSGEAQITFDFSQEKGEYSRYLFTTDLEAEDSGYKLAKDANFQAVSFIQFNTDKPEIFGTPEQKFALLAKYGMEGVIYWEMEAEKPLSEPEMKTKIDAMLEKINTLEKKYPAVKMNIFLFGNEPDFPNERHWEGDSEKFFENYAYFSRYLKSKNENYVVGTPGFAPDTVFPNFVLSDWPEKLVKYAYQNNVPLDFLSFHSYSKEIKISALDRIDKFNELLDKYPVKSQIFGRPKIANNEYDLIAHPLVEPVYRYRQEMDTAWRAAHNILTQLGMMKKGLWLASEWSGPISMVDGKGNDIDLAWITKDGKVKPVYFAHQALNNLAGTTELAESGSNFQTFGAMAGKSQDEKSVNIVFANYDEYGLYKQYPDPFMKPRQSNQLPVYKNYTIKIKNLPWTASDTIRIETYLVDDAHQMELVDSKTEKGSAELTIDRKTSTPEVQLIKITKE